MQTRSAPSAAVTGEGGLPPDLPGLVAVRLAASHHRTTALTTADGRRFWLKRVERPSLRHRLQKGNPQRALQAERRALKIFADLGLPVPDVVMEGPDFIVLSDAGTPLRLVLEDRTRDEAARLHVSAEAGRLLARLHRAGLAHGRPFPRDLCWDGRRVAFIDLERHSARRNGPFWRALDVVILIHRCFTLWPHERRWPDAILATYAAEAPAGATDQVARLAARLGWLSQLARWAARLRPGSREIGAVPAALAWLATRPNAQRDTTAEDAGKDRGGDGNNP